MIRIVEFLVGLMALDVRAQRAIDASFADWRYELKPASAKDRTVLVNVRSAIGVVRALAMAGSTDLRSGSVIPFVWRLGAIVGLWVVWMLKDGALGGTGRFFLVTSQFEAWTLVAAYLVSELLILLPAMVFVSEAVGRRNRVTPVAATSVLLAAVALIFGLVVWPASAVHLQYETWRYFANASVPEPKMGVLLLSTLSVLPTAFAIVATWLLFVFANRVRRVGGATGWAIGLGAFFAVFFVGVLATALARATPSTSTLHYDVFIALSLGRVPMILAASLWATHCLARIEARRDARLQITNSQ